MPKPSTFVAGAGGLMGGKMAERLAQQGFTVHAWNRDTTKLAGLLQANPTIQSAPSASEGVKAADVVLVMLSDGAAIRSTLLDDQAVKAALQGKTVIMMSTIGPNESKQLATDIQAAGASYLEAPVLGSLPEVANGTLQVLVGSPEHPESSTAWPVLCALSPMPRHIGTYGAASAMKLALNQLIVSETLAISASLGLVRRAGGDDAASTFMDILRASALYAPTYDKKLPKYMSRDFKGSVNFPTKHLLKDARLFCAEAEALGMDARMQRAAEAICETAVTMPGLADADYSAVYEAVAHPPSSTGEASTATAAPAEPVLASARR